MDIASILEWLQQSSLAVQIRDSSSVSLIESTHVIGLTLVFGTIAIVDLRLLGLASTQRPFQLVASETLRWTWVAFAVTALTGALMFITNATVYFHNAYSPREDRLARAGSHQRARVRADCGPDGWAVDQQGRSRRWAGRLLRCRSSSGSPSLSAGG